MAGRGLAALPSNGTLTNYTPTLRERMADALRRTFYSDDLAGQQQAEKVLNFGEAVTPLGTLTGAYDAGRDAGQGSYGGAALNLGMALLPGPNPKIRAYHGSPHDFDRFDMSKIGTGEGAQDHGKGLYFTDYEAKAMLYKNPASRWGINNDLERYSKMGPGATYEVDISADPENFLDWQKPWKDQVPEGSPLHDAIMQTNAGKDMLDQRKLYSVWNDDVESVAKKTGVPGIKDKKYGGEVDYSVFDDKLINIVRKYGLAALLPAGALAAGASQDQGGYQ